MEGQTSQPTIYGDLHLDETYLTLHIQNLHPQKPAPQTFKATTVYPHFSKYRLTEHFSFSLSMVRFHFSKTYA